MVTAKQRLHSEDPFADAPYEHQNVDAMIHRIIVDEPQAHVRVRSRRRMWRRTAVAASMAVVFGGGALAGAAIANSGHPAVVPQLGYQYAPPPSGATPAITASQATQIYLRKELAHNGPGPTGTPDSVTLVEMSAPSSPIGSLSDRLVWLVQFDNRPIIYYGPGNGSERTGTWDGVIDASTGNFLLLYNTSG